MQAYSDSDKQALLSLGVTSDSDQDDVETNHNWDAKEIEANLIASNNSNAHNGNGRTSA